MICDLSCVSMYANLGKLPIFDKSDLTLEKVDRDFVVEYLLKGYKINNIDLLSNNRLVSQNFKRLSGVFCGKDYFVSLAEGSAEYYVNNMRYNLKVYKQDMNMHVACMVDGVFKDIYKSGVGYGTLDFVPLYDGLVVVYNGDIMYIVTEKLLIGMGECHSVSSKMKEVLFA